MFHMMLLMCERLLCLTYIWIHGLWYYILLFGLLCVLSTTRSLEELRKARQKTENEKKERQRRREERWRQQEEGKEGGYVRIPICNCS